MNTLCEQLLDIIIQQNTYQNRQDEKNVNFIVYKQQIIYKLQEAQNIVCYCKTLFKLQYEDTYNQNIITDEQNYITEIFSQQSRMLIDLLINLLYFHQLLIPTTLH
ncbi:hypothetical protein pb186bvf_018953 [Paramecium bursaria]